MDAALWVFGYGSLIWNPGFAVADQQVAVLPGWRRSFCMRSIHHRGTEAEPGLVLALDRATGASCAGVAFRVEPGAEDATIATLR
jgi:cation transport protein ChaC